MKGGFSEECYRHIENEKVLHRDETEKQLMKVTLKRQLVFLENVIKIQSLETMRLTPTVPAVTNVKN